MLHVKRFTLVVLLLSVSLMTWAQTSAMTYNIRFNNEGDGANWWEYRKAAVVDLVQYYQPDIVGYQEAMPDQVTYLDEHLTQYQYIGHGRDGVGSNSEGVPLFFDTTKFVLLEEKVYWLSETPDRVSKGWDAALNRIAVLGVLKNKTTQDTLYVFNAHFDHVGQLARAHSASLLLAIIESRELQDEKVLVMGDFNCEPTDTPYLTLQEVLEDSYAVSEKKPYGPVGTFSGFDTSIALERRIDYIFVKNLAVGAYRAIDDRRNNNLYPSDHLPIWVVLN